MFLFVKGDREGREGGAMKVYPINAFDASRLEDLTSQVQRAEHEAFLAKQRLTTKILDVINAMNLHANTVELSDDQRYFVEKKIVSQYK